LLPVNWTVSVPICSQPTLDAARLRRQVPAWLVNYSNWLEMIDAVRYDAFDLDGEGVSHSGNRISHNTDCEHS